MHVSPSSNLRPSPKTDPHSLTISNYHFHQSASLFHVNGIQRSQAAGILTERKIALARYSFSFRSFFSFYFFLFPLFVCARHLSSFETPVALCGASGFIAQREEEGLGIRRPPEAILSASSKLKR